MFLFFFFFSLFFLVLLHHVILYPPLQSRRSAASAQKQQKMEAHPHQKIRETEASTTQANKTKLRKGTIGTES